MRHDVDSEVACEVGRHVLFARERLDSPDFLVGRRRLVSVARAPKAVLLPLVRDGRRVSFGRARHRVAARVFRGLAVLGALDVLRLLTELLADFGDRVLDVFRDVADRLGGVAVGVELFGRLGVELTVEQVVVRDFV